MKHTGGLRVGLHFLFLPEQEGPLPLLLSCVRGKLRSVRLTLDRHTHTQYYRNNTS